MCGVRHKILIATVIVMFTVDIYSKWFPLLKPFTLQKQNSYYYYDYWVKAKRDYLSPIHLMLSGWAKIRMQVSPVMCAFNVFSTITFLCF